MAEGSEVRGDGLQLGLLCPTRRHRREAKADGSEER